MAIAKRVAQAPKIAPIQTYQTTQLLKQVRRLGTIIDERILKSKGEWVPVLRQVPEPDRIHLDLSLAEAKEALDALMVWAYGGSTVEALRTALSSTTSTPVSPEQANAVKASANDAGRGLNAVQGTPLAASAIEAERYKMLRELEVESKKIAAFHIPFLQKQ